MCAYMCVYMQHVDFRCQHANVGGFSLSTMWVPGMKFRSAGLIERFFTYWAFSPAIEILDQGKTHLVGMCSVRNDEERILRMEVGLVR